MLLYVTISRKREVTTEFTNMNDHIIEMEKKPMLNQSILLCHIDAEIANHTYKRPQVVYVKN